MRSVTYFRITLNGDLSSYSRVSGGSMMFYLGEKENFCLKATSQSRGTNARLI